MIILSIALLVIDLFSKYLATTFLKPLGNIDLIKGVFSLTFVENSGAAFGMMQNGRWFFIILTVAVLSVLALWLIKKKTSGKLIGFSMSLIFAGALGNLIERILYGYVTDMLRVHFFDFPVFNFADCCVVIGTFLLCLYILKSE